MSESCFVYVWILRLEFEGFCGEILGKRIIGVNSYCSVFQVFVSTKWIENKKQKVDG